MKEHDAYLRELRRRRYIIVRKPRSGHLRVYCPHGCLAAIHSLNGGSDYHALSNFKADIRRHELRHENLAGEQQRQHVQG